jgi:HK97 family phage portal protein
MAFIRTLLNATKSAAVHPRDPVIKSMFDYVNVYSGVAVSPESAMRVMAVYSCVRIIAESVASLPFILYRNLEDGGKEPAPKHPLHGIIHDQPNSWQTAYEFREMMTAFCAFRGNAYAEIIPTGSNPVGALIPLHPDRVRPFRVPNGPVAYAYQPESGERRIILQEEMFHLRGMSWDGLVGFDPITIAAEAIGVAIAAERFGGSFFGNNTVLGGVLETPDELSDKAYERLKKSWADRHEGSGNSHKPAILESGLKWHSIGLEPEKAQFLETRKFQITEIARLFRVPPHMLADLERATFSNIEHLSIDFVVNTLRPWLIRWEQAVKRDLLTETGRRGFFAEHKIDGLLRGDTKSRFEAYQIAAGGNAPWITRNEVRGFENMNPLPGLSRPLRPLNMSDGSEPSAPPPAPKEKDEPPLPDAAAEARALRRLAAARIIRKEAVALRKNAKKYEGNTQAFAKWADDFFAGQVEQVAVSLQLDTARAQAFCDIARARVIESEDLEAELRAWEDLRCLELVPLLEGK